MAEKIQRPKGTADVSPSEAYIWQEMERILRDTARAYGYREARFPMFEHTELFNRGIGDTTDVVQKEMYTFTDKGGRSITLRPEGTASVVRSYIENGEAQHGAPYKAYYIVPNFRYEKPQAGRLRQHHQFGIECFGAPGFYADAEVIALAQSYLNRLQIKTSLHINSIGCPNCRPTYHKALKEYFEARREELCPTCLTRLDKNPVRILDCKSEICQDIAKDAPRSIDYLCEECGTHFEGVKTTLADLGLAFTVDTKIVRGLDYYTKTVFEFISTDIGAQGTVCGGGRYDGLIEQLGGPPTPGIGFGSGIERLIMAAKASGYQFAEPAGCDIYLAGAGADGAAKAFLLADALRKLGLSAESDLCDRSIKAQMKHADRIGARFTAVIGGDELAGGTVEIRNMAGGEKTPAAMEADAIAAAIRGE